MESARAIFRLNGIGARRFVLLVASGLFIFTGCLPHSCQREANEALFPADSLSRRVSAEAPVDSLEQTAILDGGPTETLSYPRTVRFMPDGKIAVSDVERNSVYLFRSTGGVHQRISDSGFAVPYLIGTRGDTLAVFNAETDRVDFVTEAGRDRTRSFTYQRSAPETLVYMVAGDTALYAKVVGQKTGASITRLTRSGQTVAETELTGPYWRRAGFLRTWGDTLLSLSGFRPVVQTLPLDFAPETRPDSLRLVGFDSPMLERSFAFAQGDVTKPPLLLASGVPVGRRLFVLNLRPGWVQIDVYTQDGQLERRLVEPHEKGDRNFYPVDIDARKSGRGYEFAVAVRSPQPQVELFRWQTETVERTRRTTDGSGH